MINVVISIASHNDSELIEKNFKHIPKILGNYKIQIMVIDNTNDVFLERVCQNDGYSYYADECIRGYGENNNKNFELSNLQNKGVFIVCNPDVIIQVDIFEELLDRFFIEDTDIFGVKVFESKDLLTFSSHNRSFPCLFDPIVSLIFKKKLFVEDADEYGHPDWIGGAFMVFDSSSFRRLQGFSNTYFMYYEDTDICHRAKKMKMKIVYNPNFYIVHEAKRAGRNLFSKHFYWNLTSMIKYFLKFPPKCILGKNYFGK